MTLLWLKYCVKALVLPPTGPLLLALAGLAIAGRYPRRGRWLAAIGVLALSLLSMPAVGDFLTRCLNRIPALDPGAALSAQAIVILGGGIHPYAAEYGGASVGTITLARVRYGARLARATGLPVLVSGGAIRGTPPEALLMRNVLVQEYGVPVRWVETRSRNTHENAVRSAAILEASGVARIILVGHSFDFPRSQREFEAAGMTVIAAPIAIPPEVPSRLADFHPSADGLRASYYALYEMLANVLLHFTTGHHPAASPAVRSRAPTAG
jgi:uncharacterized SAM-binding protein YcdF (DUF218 family)